MTNIKVTNANESHKHKRRCCCGGHAKISGDTVETSKSMTTSTSTPATQTAALAVAAVAARASSRQLIQRKSRDKGHRLWRDNLF
jgi:hypothetical protein